MGCPRGDVFGDRSVAGKLPTDAYPAMMAAGFDLVTFDAADTDTFAAFWMAVADLVEVEREDDDRWIVLADNGGIRRVGVQRGEAAAGGVHLDLVVSVDEFDVELDRIVKLGAVLVDRRREPYGEIANLVDVAGYRFDLCAYR